MPPTARFLVITDSFGTLVQQAITEYREAIEQCHALLLLGDLPSMTYPILRRDLGIKTRGFCVLGNHDGLDWPDWLPRYRIEHLHKRVVSLRMDEQQVSFGGFSGSEKYTPGSAWQWDDNEASRQLNDLPACDILLTHTSDTHPMGYQDDPGHRGLPAIGKYIEKKQPYLALHGHFHQNYRKQIGRTIVVGCYGAVLLDCHLTNNRWEVTANPLVSFPWLT